MKIVHCVATGTDTPLNITWATSVEQHDVEVREYRGKQKAVVPKILTEPLWEDLCVFFCVGASRSYSLAPILVISVNDQLSACVRP